MTIARGNIGHGHVYERPDGVKARCGGPRMCHACAIDAAGKSLDEAEDKDGEVILAVALPPHTGNPLGDFTYDGVFPNKKFIRENGPSNDWSQGDTDDDGTATTDTEGNKP